ncbi:hypothetical protein NR996_01700 [Lactobacillus rodentium]|uniref:DNA/RNA non-specific endonuclease domain-containing protein n=1 Tax=Lactobacillus rodentium TaxID=947835 RepID=A0A2Z6TEJ0_9LACO|nr:hypothetical protein [Lactobacillus rodentium]MCR1894126.1 hypothetical protein [Lactobacillus rodentium]GBG04422.1 hypothetical protein LrDSM24759_03360 [Lactobacillus rodentium]
MNEEDVFKRMGFSNCDFDNEQVVQLAPYNLNYKENYFEVEFKEQFKEKQEKLIENYKYVLSNSQSIVPIYFYGRVVGWRIILNKEQAESNKQYEPPFLRINSNNTEADKKINERDAHEVVQGGHILGNFIHNYFPFESFFGNHHKKTPRRNVYDEYPQFKRANENRRLGSGKNGQGYFESLIAKYNNEHQSFKLNNNEMIFYYECEAIFKEKDDKIPIGTRLFVIKNLDKLENINKQKNLNHPDKLDIPVHVFIPNCDYAEENLASVPNDLTVENYREFFKNGKLSDLHIKKFDE